MTKTILVAGNNRDLEDLFRSGGLVSHVSPDVLEGEAAVTPMPADVLVLDLRDRLRLPAWISEWKRRHPAGAAVLVLSAPDAGLMLTAMRAGITECLVEPLTSADVQAALARITTGAAAAPGEVFAFVGAKGGVGTTTLAVNVAAALSRIADGTLLIDLHAAGGDASLMLGVEPRFSMADALDNTHRADEAYFRGLLTQTPSGIPLLAAAGTAFGRPIERGRVRALIEFVRYRYRYIVIDVQRATPWAVEALDAAGNVVVVTNQELASLRSAATLASALRDAQGVESIGAVLNRYDDRAPLDKSDVEQVVGLPVMARFPGCYRAISDAVTRGQPVPATSALGKAVERFARDLARLSGELTGRTGVLSRVGASLAAALTGGV